MSNIQAVFDRLAGLAKEQELRKQEATQLKDQVKQRQIQRAIKSTFELMSQRNYIEASEINIKTNNQ